MDILLKIGSETKLLPTIFSPKYAVKYSRSRHNNGYVCKCK